MKTRKFYNIKFEISPLFLVTIIYFIIFSDIYSFLLIFSAVFLHELAHFVVAEIRGYPAEVIQILPIGTALKFNSLQELKSLDEILIAGAGPLFNIILSIILIFFKGSPFFIAINLIIGIFNLLPIFPLDGGRILRAILIRNYNYIIGTKFVCNMTKFVSCVFVVISVINSIITKNYNNIFICFIFIYIFINSKNQHYFSNFIGINGIFKKKNELYKSGVIRANILVCTGETKIKKVLNELLSEYYNIIYILDNKSRVGYVLTETELIETMVKLNYDCTLEDIIKEAGGKING